MQLFPDQHFFAEEVWTLIKPSLHTRCLNQIQLQAYLLLVGWCRLLLDWTEPLHLLQCPLLTYLHCLQNLWQSPWCNPFLIISIHWTIIIKHNLILALFTTYNISDFNYFWRSRNWATTLYIFNIHKTYSYIWIFQYQNISLNNSYSFHVY